MRLPRSLSGWTIAVFGLLSLALGLYGLIWPDGLLRLMGFAAVRGRATGDYTTVFMAASSMAAINMGVYYLFAAAADFTPFFRWTVPFRLVTFSVFTGLVLSGSAPPAFFGVGLWEGIGALATGLALWREGRLLPSRLLPGGR